MAREVKIVQYEAKDGMLFDSKKEALAYEKKLETKLTDLSYRDYKEKVSSLKKGIEDLSTKIKATVRKDTKKRLTAQLRKLKSTLKRLEGLYNWEKCPSCGHKNNMKGLRKRCRYTEKSKISDFRGCSAVGGVVEHWLVREILTCCDKCKYVFEISEDYIEDLTEERPF